VSESTREVGLSNLSNEERRFEPPADLVAFLHAGPPPVYIGFGSMIGQNTARLTTLVLITCGGPFDEDGGRYRDNIVVFAERVS